MFNNLLKLRLPYREDSLFGILLVTIFFVPIFFFPLLQDPFETPRFALAAIFAGAAVLILLWRAQWESRIAKPLAALLVAFVVLHLLSTLLSVDILNSIPGIYGRFANSLIFVVIWAVLIFLFSLVNSENKVISIFKALAISGLLVAGLGIMHIYGIGFYSASDSPARPIVPGFIGNQNFAAIFLVGILPLIVPLYRQARNRASQAWYLAVAFVMIWGLMIFASRGAILAFLLSLVAGLILLFIRKTGWQVRTVVASFLVAGLLLGATFFSFTRVAENSASLDINSDPSSITRIIVWTESLKLIGEHPWLGWGPGNFYIGFKTLANTSLPGTERFDDAHNLYLHIATTAGIPAALVFIAIILWALYSSYKTFKADGSLIAWGTLVGIVALAISAGFSPVNISSWMLLGFLIVVSQYALPPKEIVANKQQRWLIAVLGIFLIYAGIGFISSDYLSLQSQYAYRAGEHDKAIRLGRASQILNPTNGFPQIYVTAARIKLQQDPAMVRDEITKLVDYHKRSSGNYKYAADLSYMLYQYSKDNQDLETAYRHLETQVQLEPNYAPVLINKAYLNFLTGRTDIAEQTLRQGLSLSAQGDLFFAWVLFAEIQLERGNTEAMYEALSHAYQINPNPILKALMREYESGQFNRDKLPLAIPPVDV